VPVPTLISELSTTAGSNSPAGGDPPAQGDDHIRALGAFVAQLRDKLDGTATGAIIFGGNVSVNGNTTLGNATTDTLTVNPAAVTWSGNPTHSGNHTFSGNVTAANIAATASGTWTPSMTAVTNVSAVTASAGQYGRVGGFCSASVVLDITVTTTGISSEVRLALPVGGVLSSFSECAGHGSMSNGAAPGAVFGRGGFSEAVFRFVPTLGSASYYLNFSYRVF
jgi:hypothetical protein